MMDSIRSAASGWAAKVLIALLVLSFAVWGVNDVFFGFRSEVLASVGELEISAESFRRSFDQQLRILSRQSGRPLTAENARQIGLDRQILAEMLRDGTLEEQARVLKLAVPREAVARDIADNQAFQNARGEFDPALFRRLLAQNGLDEQSFLAGEMAARGRRAIAETIAGSFTTPETLVEAAVRHGTEERDARYFVITGNESEIAAPSATELQEFYDKNQRLFTTPAYRSLVLLILRASDLAARMTVTDDELEAAYEKRRPDYQTAERRTVEQIAFPTMAEARQAKDRIAAGADFLVEAKERGLSEKDAALGDVAKSEIADAALANAAFALAEGAVSDPVQGRLSVSLVRVTKITPATTRTFVDVRGELLGKLKLEKAEEEIQTLHARVEDERAGGASFEEIGKTTGIPLVVVPAVDQTGRDASGKPVQGIPGIEEVLQLAFDGDVGVEIEPASLGDDGVVWLDIRDAKPAGVKPFNIAKGEVETAFKARKVRDQV
ncbi:MAG: SurA N-terminal domain-containing protein, partial [Pseudomonadota bacterium]|nr:SurA N-terminal domain-containing protein [Pseudomonadota bacterium]